MCLVNKVCVICLFQRRCFGRSRPPPPQQQAYLAKIRSLKFNLAKPDNPDLRRDVLAGLISAERFVSMTPEEMAPEKVGTGDCAQDAGICALELDVTWYSDAGMNHMHGTE